MKHDLTFHPAPDQNMVQAMRPLAADFEACKHRAAASQHNGCFNNMVTHHAWNT